MNTNNINKAKDTVAKKYGYDGWITIERFFERGKLSLTEFNLFTDEAMSFYHQTEIEEVGQELPSDNLTIEMYDAIRQEQEDNNMVDSISKLNQWMRSEASKIITKEREAKSNTINLLMRKISEANDLVLEREKEIESLKSKLNK